VGDLLGLEARGRYLIKQRLKTMVIVPVDDKHVCLNPG
jgi:hypothetical protein